MKKFTMLAMVLVMMLVSLEGCYFVPYDRDGGRGRDRGHDRDGGRDRDDGRGERR